MKEANSPRFVDRDMYMRFRGGGVGHSFLPLRTEAQDVESDDDSEDDSDVIPAVNTVDADEDEEIESSESDSSEDEADTNLMPQTDDHSSEEEIDDDFDPEDGEGNVLDIENDEGYDEL